MGRVERWGIGVPAAVVGVYICLCLFIWPSVWTPAAALSSSAADISWDGRIVAIGDLHGDAENAMLLLDALGVLDRNTRKWTGGDTLLVQTGDIVDRGPDGKILYDLFAELKQQAEEQGGKVVQILGNHDAMNLCGDFR